jgi:hypothetical protein
MSMREERFFTLQQQQKMNEKSLCYCVFFLSLSLFLPSNKYCVKFLLWVFSSARPSKMKNTRERDVKFTPSALSFFCLEEKVSLVEMMN